MFYLFNLFCGIVLEKEKEREILYSIESKDTEYYYRNIKNPCRSERSDDDRYFQVLLQAFSPNYSRLRQGSAWAQDFKDIWGSIEKPYPRKQTYILKTKAIISKMYRYNEYKFTWF